MHFIAVLNRDGGALRTIDLDAFAARAGQVLDGRGHRLDVEIVAGAAVEAALAEAARSHAEIVIAGGGDGTVSAAAKALMSTDNANLTTGTSIRS